MKSDAIKKKRSKDYGTPTSNLGHKGFDSFLRRAQSKKDSESASHQRALKLRTQLERETLRAYGHYLAHGDHRSLARLIQSNPGQRTQRAIIAWVSSVSSLRWDESLGRFHGRRSATDLSLEIASKRAILSQVTPTPYVRSPRSLPRCRVCQCAAMPGEDTCYHHQSG